VFITNNVEIKICSNKQSITKICKAVNQVDTDILVMKKKPFRNCSKSETYPEQPNPGNH
jgi:hypothetical protein